MMEPTEEQYREWSMQAQWSTDLACMAYQAGADEQLRLCVEWLRDANAWADGAKQMQAAMRPKPQPAGESAEQQARDLLDRMGVPDAQSFSAGDLVELANLIAMRPKPPSLKQQALRDLDGMVDYIRITQGFEPADPTTIRQALESLPGE